MTFVDDNLLGTAPVRPGKSGSKPAGKSHDMDAANQRSAFENAFADAGKKKQPAVSISAKPAVEGSLAPNLKPSAEALAASSKQSGVDALAASGDGLSSLQGLATERDGFMKSSLGSSATADPHATGKTISAQGSLAAAKGPQKFSLMQASFAGVGEDTGKTVDGPIGETIAGLMKNAEASTARSGDKTGRPADTSAVNPPDEAADAVTGDVSQLLSLLDATQKSVAASQPAQAEATPGMSEFQALAERAKAKPAAKDAAKAGADKAGDANAVRNATQAGSDQVFRFARADGKGQAVSMSLASDGDKAVAKNEASATAAKAETVTVLEARRYLGLAPVSNAAAVTSRIANSPEWASALQPGAGVQAPLTQASTGKVLNTLKIQMHPIDLGMITATLRLKDDELHVEIKVETGDAFRQLSDDQSAMVKALRAQGFAVDQVNIVFNASDTSGSSNAQQQAQPQAGQQGRETPGDGAKGQRNDNGSQEQGRERWTGNEGTGDATSAAELNRAGDVYM
ncbi:flagellar hook-length control protein FliK [Pararhizobium sp. YC-54]|uniref:flagellar hook-length control protein FliK n=1 Tax=Pararhizobium sp. YC-54 TaxID=2986920 RepID=UPI0021F7FEAE|nr:flagellar hook-length control protein FliK [Pararhizobium sp. YC-54]MCV9998734.1 flagellar hook-length control protein FliK [Pararhizobium sp. YC-54]